MDDKFLNIINDINDISEKLYIIYEKELRYLDIDHLSNQEQVILNLVISNPSYSPSKLAQSLNISKSAISQQLLRLEQKKYIKKYKSEDDKRSTNIRVIDKGLKYKKLAEERYNQTIQKYKANLTLNELIAIRDSLKKLVGVID